MKRIYEDNRPNDRISLEKLKQHFISLADVLQSNYRLETDEQLGEFNKHLISESEAETEINNDIIEGEPKTKRCGGQWHTTEEERVLPIDSFYRHKSHKDGRARLCKDCYAKSLNRQGYNEKLRRDKPLPSYDTSTHKWCNRCESIKLHEEFYNTTSTKDGLSPNCKECKREQKQKQIEKRKQPI